MEQFLQDLESSLGVPAVLLERAAEARAEVIGSSADSIVRTWAGVGEDTAAPAPAAEPAAATAPEVTEPTVPDVAPEPPAAAAAPAAPAAAPSGAAPGELLADLGSSLGVPVDLLERAAEARAAADGLAADNIVRSWTGAEEAPAATPTPAAPPPSPEPAPAASTPEPAVATEPAPVLAVEVLEATESAPESAEDEAVQDEAAGVLAGFPAWLSAALLVIPILALSYAMLAPNGPGCGTSGQLAIDAETGLAENCDGTEYGVDATSFFTIGEDVYLEGANCDSCHGEAGGGGTGPAFSGGAVLVTFPEGSCSDHLEWVTIGTDNWPNSTYGANETVLGSSGASMPGFPELTPEDLVAVTIYERVAFGGQSLADAEADCGAAELEIAGG